MSVPVPPLCWIGWCQAHVGTALTRMPSKVNLRRLAASGILSREELSRIALEVMEKAIKNPLWALTPAERRHGRGPN